MKQGIRKLSRVGKINIIRNSMGSYNVQKFSYDGPGDSKCYGRQDQHDHNIANQFTIDVKTYLETEGYKNVQAGDFLSNQKKPDSGKEFKWDSVTIKWVKV